MCKSLPVGQFEPTATGNASAVERCKNWIKDCSENHQSCASESGRLPKRIIDVGFIDGKVRVHITGPLQVLMYHEVFPLLGRDKPKSWTVLYLESLLG